MPTRSVALSVTRPALTQMSRWVANPAIEEHLSETQHVLDSVTQTSLEDMSLVQVVDAFWPRADGWEVVSMEPGFYYVTVVVEHPDHGVGVSLIGAAAVTCPYSRGSVETWSTLRLYDRRVHVRGSIHAQAPNRLALILALNSRYEAATTWTLGTRALAHAVVSCAALMDAPAQMMVGLSGAALVAEAEEFRAYAAGHEMMLPPLPVRAVA